MNLTVTFYPPISPQSTSAPFCNLTVGGLDPGRCYDFRVRATPQDFFYGPEARPSKWTVVPSLQGVGPTGEDWVMWGPKVG